MDPMSPASAALLRLESDGAPLHVGWIARLDAGEVDVGALRERIARRLPEPSAGARQRLRCVAGRSEPVWRADPDFAVARHVGELADVGGGEEAVGTAIDRVLAEPLPRDRPLWRVLVVPRAAGGGAVLVGIAHRALVDGGGEGVLRELVFDRGQSDGADGAGGGEGSGGRGGGVGPLAGVAGAGTSRDAALDELRAVRGIGALDAQRAAGMPSARLGSTLRRAAMARMEGLTAAPRSFLDAGAGARRTLVTTRLELGRLAAIAERTATGAHDVELAVVAGALRRIALATGAEPVDLRAMVPVDPGDERLLGDAPAAIVELPVSQRGAGERLARIHAALEAARGRPGEGAPGGRPARTPTLLAGPGEELATRLVIGARLCNLAIPRTRGPQRPLHVGGVHVRALFPVAPPPDEHALGLATLSYGRHLHVAAAADPGAVGDAGRLPVLLADAVAELEAAPAHPARRAAVMR